jgi:hypothetical protein
VTGRADEPFDDVPCDPLVRVVTGWLAWAGAGAELCEPLVRVVTGWLAGAGAGAELCEPLAWVTTGATEADVWTAL